MCGRFTVATDPAVLAERFAVEIPDDWTPTYNAAPTQDVLGIINAAKRTERTISANRFAIHWLAKVARMATMPSTAPQAKVVAVQG